MARFTKFVLFGLTPELSDQMGDEANRQKISVYQLIRMLGKHLRDLRAARENTEREYAAREKADREYAAWVLKAHFDEDRNEFLSENTIRHWPRQ